MTIKLFIIASTLLLLATIALAAPVCQDWVAEYDSNGNVVSYFHVCVDDNGSQYCERGYPSNGKIINVTRVSCK